MTECDLTNDFASSSFEFAVLYFLSVVNLRLEPISSLSYIMASMSLHKSSLSYSLKSFLLSLQSLLANGVRPA